MNDFIKDENLHLTLAEKQKSILLHAQIITITNCIINYYKLLWDN